MSMPNGLLSYRVIKENLNADRYINLLEHHIVPIIKLNYGNEYYFQHDNSSIYQSKKVKEFILTNEISTFQWPEKSPDLNIVEDCWKMLSDMVYDGLQFEKKTDLIEKIKKAINEINSLKRYKVVKLYESIRSRLCTVIEKCGNLCNR